MQKTLATTRPSSSIAKQVSDLSRTAKSAAVSFSTLDGGSMASWPKASCASASSSSARAASVKRWTWKSYDMFGVRPWRLRAQRGLDRRERCLGPRPVRSTGLRHVRAPAAPLPTKRLGAFLDEINRVEARSQVIGHAHDDAGLALFGDADQRHD